VTADPGYQPRPLLADKPRHREPTCGDTRDSVRTARDRHSGRPRDSRAARVGEVVQRVREEVVRLEHAEPRPLRQARRQRLEARRVGVLVAGSRDERRTASEPGQEPSCRSLKESELGTNF
jgi:hypothetical protein